MSRDHRRLVLKSKNTVEEVDLHKIDQNMHQNDYCKDIIGKIKKNTQFSDLIKVHKLADVNQNIRNKLTPVKSEKIQTSKSTRSLIKDIQLQLQNYLTEKVYIEDDSPDLKNNLKSNVIDAALKDSSFKEYLKQQITNSPPTTQYNSENNGLLFTKTKSQTSFTGLNFEICEVFSICLDPLQQVKSKHFIYLQNESLNQKIKKKRFQIQQMENKLNSMRIKMLEDINFMKDIDRDKNLLKSELFGEELRIINNAKLQNDIRCVAELLQDQFNLINMHVQRSLFLKRGCSQSYVQSLNDKFVSQIPQFLTLNIKQQKYHAMITSFTQKIISEYAEVLSVLSSTADAFDGFQRQTKQYHQIKQYKDKLVLKLRKQLDVNDGKVNQIFKKHRNLKRVSNRNMFATAKNFSQVKLRVKSSKAFLQPEPKPLSMAKLTDPQDKISILQGDLIQLKQCTQKIKSITHLLLILI